MCHNTQTVAMGGIFLGCSNLLPLKSWYNGNLVQLPKDWCYVSVGMRVGFGAQRPGFKTQFLHVCLTQMASCSSVELSGRGHYLIPVPRFPLFWESIHLIGSMRWLNALKLKVQCRACRQICMCLLVLPYYVMWKLLDPKMLLPLNVSEPLWVAFRSHNTVFEPVDYLLNLLKCHVHPPFPHFLVAFV